MPAPDRKTHAPSRRWLMAGVVGAAVLVVAGGAAFYYASLHSDNGKSAGDVEVAVTASACEPNELTVPAGKRSFEIVNRSDRPVEWEIIDGVMVVAERENIAPGFRQTVSARLVPGEYEITCGLLSNPRGVLRVTPSGEADQAQGQQPTLRAYLGPLAEYKVFLAMQGSAMVKDAEKLAEAIKAGDLDKARSLYEPARLPYKRVEPIAVRFADLQHRIDPVADYLEGREADPAFTGYHRLEYGLFSQQSLAGLEPIASGLIDDLTALKDRLRGQKLRPSLLIDSAAGMARQLGEGRLEQGEERYAGTDLAGVEANLAGIRKIVDLLVPVVEPASPDAAKAVQAKLTGVEALLAKEKSGSGFAPYDQVSQTDRDALIRAFQELADALDTLSPAIGIGES
ncbi:iron uptake system protein EfeO [Consotaella aegiceratis]|uniref:iron uptake system protein EfeO n=1 Tax=Consotaella aegiceratis TaxID=3097961 RepID=UPI002F401453